DCAHDGLQSAFTRPVTLDSQDVAKGGASQHADFQEIDDPGRIAAWARGGHAVYVNRTVRPDPFQSKAAPGVDRHCGVSGRRCREDPAELLEGEVLQRVGGAHVDCNGMCAAARIEASIGDIDEEWRVAELAPERSDLRWERLAHEVDEIDAAGEEFAKPIGRERNARVDLDRGARVQLVKLPPPARHQRQHGAATRASQYAGETPRRYRATGSA